jgi:hypothetical protein
MNVCVYRPSGRFIFTICAICGFWALSATSVAQKWEIGAGLGGSNYKGDLAPRFNFRNTQPGVHIFGKMNPIYFLSLRAGFTFADFGAADSLSKDPFLQRRNLWFQGNMRELSAVAEYNFFNFRSGQRKRFEKWCPYLFAGLAANNFTVRNNFINERERYNSTIITIPFGVGIKHYLHPNWNLGFEFGARKTFTDRLDGITGSLDEPKFRRTNIFANDMFYYTSISLSYVFYGVRCPNIFK